MIRAGDHEFADGTAIDRCVHCGTIYEQHQHSPQPCVPHVRGETLMPEPALRIRAADDTDAIYDRIVELRKERDEHL